MRHVSAFIACFHCQAPPRRGRSTTSRVETSAQPNDDVILRLHLQQTDSHTALYRPFLFPNCGGWRPSGGGTHSRGLERASSTSTSTTNRSYRPGPPCGPRRRSTATLARRTCRRPRTGRGRGGHASASQHNDSLQFPLIGSFFNPHTRGRGRRSRAVPGTPGRRRASH